MKNRSINCSRPTELRPSQPGFEWLAGSWAHPGLRASPVGNYEGENAADLRQLCAPFYVPMVNICSGQKHWSGLHTRCLRGHIYVWVCIRIWVWKGRCYQGDSLGSAWRVKIDARPDALKKLCLRSLLVLGSSGSSTHCFIAALFPVTQGGGRARKWG